MKRFVFLTLLMGFVLTFLGISVATPSKSEAYSFGDFKSSTLVTKAWEALTAGDTEAVLAYTNKCIELYAEEARKMQNSLNGYVEGEKEKIFSMWALNDVATALFIQGEAYRKTKMLDEAKQAFRTVSTVYKYGQTWDPQGWFWKPAEAAKEKLAMIESGSDMDFGNYSSSFIVGQAWKTFNSGDYATATIYVDKVLELYTDQAKEMQASLTEYPWENKEKIMSYWALNDVGTALYIKGEALRKQGKKEEAKKVYEKLVNEFFYAQC